MKTCQICTTENESYADTCVACGEGSFALVESAPNPAAEEVAAEPAQEAPMSAQRRSRR